MASMTAAVSTMPTATCATGSPKKTTKNLRPRPKPWSSSTTPTRPVPGLSRQRGADLGREYCRQLGIGHWLQGLPLVVGISRSTRDRGHSPADQRVYLGWVQVWRGKAREARNHPAHQDRPAFPRRACAAWRPLRNQAAFYKAFNLKPGDKMFLPAEQARQHLVGQRFCESVKLPGGGHSIRRHDNSLKKLKKN